MKRTPGIAAAAGSMSELARRLPAPNPAAASPGEEPSSDRGVNESVSGVSLGVEMAFRAVTLGSRGRRGADGPRAGRRPPRLRPARRPLRRPVVNYLTRLTRDRSRAEELAQDAFLRLYERAVALPGAGAAPALPAPDREQPAALRGAPVAAVADAVGPGRLEPVGAGAQPGAAAALGRGDPRGRGRDPGAAAALSIAAGPARDRGAVVPRDRDRAGVP